MTSADNTYKPLWQTLLTSEGEQTHPRFGTIWMVVLFLGGLLVWGIFFNWGNISFDFHDWAEITAPRMGVIDDAVDHWVFPLHASSVNLLKGSTDRMLVIPDVIITPQQLLLSFLPLGTYVLVDIWLLYAVGFWGLLRLRKKFNLGLIPFTLLFLLFNFNGHIAAHLSVGHFSWGSYFLLPWFFYLIFRFLDGDTTWKWIAEMAGWMFLIVLQGGYHQFIWALMFLGLLGILLWRKFLYVVAAGLASGLLSAVRLLPPALGIDMFSSEMSFIGGYPTPFSIIQSFLMRQIPAIAIQPYQNFSSPLGYWEFDVYIGFAGAAILGLGMLAFLWQEAHKRRYWAVLLPMAVITILSIGTVYSFIADLPIPLLSGERVTSRMFSMVMLCAMILSVVALQNWLNANRSKWMSAASVMFGMGLLGKLGYDLIRHVLAWQITSAVSAFPYTPFNFSEHMSANHADPLYLTMIWLGLGISLATAVGLFLLVRRENKKKTT